MIGEQKIAVPVTREDGTPACVIDPMTGRQVPKDGLPVTVDVFWFRRHEAGDIELRNMEPEPTPAPVEEPQKEKRRRGARGDA